MTLSHPNPAATSPSQGCGGEAGALSSPRSAPADLTFGPFTVRDGRVFRGSEPYSPITCEALIAVLEHEAGEPGAWGRQARRHALDLHDAMKAAGLILENAA
jgi:hypothetical protein